MEAERHGENQLATRRLTSIIVCFWGSWDQLAPSQVKFRSCFSFWWGDLEINWLQANWSFNRCSCPNSWRQSLGKPSKSSCNVEISWREVGLVVSFFREFFFREFFVSFFFVSFSWLFRDYFVIISWVFREYFVSISWVFCEYFVSVL